MNYILVRGRVEILPKAVTENLRNGHQLYGNPFRTGNKIILERGSVPGYVAEIAQAMIKDTPND